MAFGITDLKKGTIFEFEGEPYRVIEYAQKVMGRGGSIVNVKIKSLVDGKVLSKTFKGNEQLEPADVVNKPVQYLYNDGKTCFFMDQDTFEQFEVGIDKIGEKIDYLKEGFEVNLQDFNGQIISVELPKNVYLKVVSADNAVKGDTTSALTKNAVVETGKTIKVPAFIKVGDEISVDTETGAYRERKKD